MAKGQSLLAVLVTIPVPDRTVKKSASLLKNHVVCAIRI